MSNIGAVFQNINFPPVQNSFRENSCVLFEEVADSGGPEIFQNQGGKKKKGERGIFEIFIQRKIAGDETSNRKQNLRMNLKMFS